MGGPVELPLGVCCAALVRKDREKVLLVRLRRVRMEGRYREGARCDSVKPLLQLLLYLCHTFEVGALSDKGLPCLWKGQGGWKLGCVETVPGSLAGTLEGVGGNTRGSFAGTLGIESNTSAWL